MKIRNGFVSNSSSSSFIANISHLDDAKKQQFISDLEDYLETNYGCGWDISISKNKNMVGFQTIK